MCVYVCVSCPVLGTRTRTTGGAGCKGGSRQLIKAGIAILDHTLGAQQCSQYFRKSSLGGLRVPLREDRAIIAIAMGPLLYIQEW
jgi:hypothetical protein